MQGRVGEALSWAREQGLSADDDVSYLREYRAYHPGQSAAGAIQAHRTDAPANEAARLLDRLLTAAEAGQRTGSVIEILVLQALTHHARGDTSGALAPMERALTLAEPEGYVRVFVGEGAPMVALLRAVAKQQASWRYVRRLVDACGRPVRRRGRPPGRPARASSSPSANASLGYSGCSEPTWTARPSRVSSWCP